MTTIAVIGAGGKAGYRVSRNLKDNPDYTTFYVEINDAAIARLTELGVSVTPQDEALEAADVVILAVPDALIGEICQQIVPGLSRGTMVIGLDPAAGYAGVLLAREDITYFISHPCHPPLFQEETDPEARQDFFGGVKAKHSVVCALHHGPETDFTRGEAIARAIWAPVTNTYRITTEQMAILEPGLTETFAATCISVLREGLEEAIRMGVPEAAAREFFFGHLRCAIAIIFDVSGFPMSEGSKLAISRAKKRVFQPDWKKVMSIESVQQTVKEIAHVVPID
ncbi:MAG: phosphogluconate dehydrogenase C-terminal domain-containing protein [Dehalococcoidales bacterium]|jgi:hypothetical protein|nr:phosphogluconate dehydrogenase C-terminal domain-containing protein [Dehalococcoidales bacterium]MDP7415524.1 phosphogluconate dehydrogenase C-terminal domain-containing protein [Dehalococcoidales bacterium]